MLTLVGALIQPECFLAVLLLGSLQLKVEIGHWRRFPLLYCIRWFKNNDSMKALTHAFYP